MHVQVNLPALEMDAPERLSDLNRINNESVRELTNTGKTILERLNDSWDIMIVCKGRITIAVNTSVNMDFAKIQRKRCSSKKKEIQASRSKRGSVRRIWESVNG